jgi:hypothetical protein
MTPQELSARHRTLFHVTPAGAARSILDSGLYSTKDILERWEAPMARRMELMTRRRRLPVPLDHPRHGRFVINDNAPLSEGKLARILDDGLTSGQWLEMLNSRVFFFTHKKVLERLTGARLNRDKTKDVLELDTERLAEAYGALMEIVPINSGNTNHQPARRGYATFAALFETDYQAWRRRRGKKSLDSIKEVAVRGSIPDIANFVVNVTEGSI